MKQNAAIVVIGAGMSGMLAALLLRQRHPSGHIIILEHSGQPGGHYREVTLDGFGRCDRAMRLLYETGIPEFDHLIRSILPDDEWQVFPDNEKDIAGIYWQGSLQCHSAYPDLRRLPPELSQQCEREIMQCLLSANTESAINAADYLHQRFGPTAAGYFIRVLEKLYHVPATQLDISATHQPAMNRVVLYDEKEMLSVLRDEHKRSVIAWPDQLMLPMKRNPSQSALYPKRFGLNRVIDTLQRRLSDEAIEFRFRCQPASLAITNHMITSLTLDNGSVIENPSLVVAANGLHAAFHLLRNEAAPRPPAPPCWLVFLRMKAPPRMERLYHFYCFDEGFATFRVTHYYNYCADARDDAGYPLCIELWSDDTNPDQAIARAIAELRRMNVLEANCDITAQGAMHMPNLHALCTVDYANHMRDMRAEVKRQAPHNMVTVGPFAEDGVLLLYEVWRDMYHKLQR